MSTKGYHLTNFFKRYNDNGHFYFNGIDRVDNFKGYTLENSVPCCTICNRAKSNMLYDDFMSYIQRFKSRVDR